LRTDEAVVGALRFAPGDFLEPAIRIHADSGDDVQGHVDLRRKAFTSLRPYLCRRASPRTILGMQDPKVDCTLLLFTMRQSAAIVVRVRLGAPETSRPSAGSG